MNIAVSMYPLPLFSKISKAQAIVEHHYADFNHDFKNSGTHLQWSRSGVMNRLSSEWLEAHAVRIFTIGLSEGTAKCLFPLSP